MRRLVDVFLQVRAEAEATEEWMYDSLNKQGEQETWKDPILTVKAIGEKRSALFGVTNPIMTKPR